jgi:hypothetical protein
VSKNLYTAAGSLFQRGYAAGGVEKVETSVYIMTTVQVIVRRLVSPTSNTFWHQNMKGEIQ